MFSYHESDGKKIIAALNKTCYEKNEDIKK